MVEGVQQGPVLVGTFFTPSPIIPNQHHFIQKSAHEVPDANLEARVRPVFT